MTDTTARASASRLAAGVVATALCAGAFAADAWMVTTAGFGPLRIGMTQAEAARALGAELVVTFKDGPECYYVAPRPAIEGLSIMMSGDRVVRVDIGAPGVRTRSRIGVGDDEARVRRAYGREVEVTPHHYVAPDGHYLTVWTADRRHAVRFETHQGKVTSYYAGRADAVRLVEGCA